MRAVRTCRLPGEILAGKAVSFSSFAGHEFYFAEPGTTTKKSEARKLGKPYREALAKFLIVKGQTQYEYKPELKPPPLASVPKDPLKCATRRPLSALPLLPPPADVFEPPRSPTRAARAHSAMGALCAHTTPLRARARTSCA